MSTCREYSDLEYLVPGIFMISCSSLTSGSEVVHLRWSPLCSAGCIASTGYQSLVIYRNSELRTLATRVSLMLIDTLSTAIRIPWLPGTLSALRSWDLRTAFGHKLMIAHCLDDSGSNAFVAVADNAYESLSSTGSRIVDDPFLPVFKFPINPHQFGGDLWYYIHAFWLLCVQQFFVYVMYKIHFHKKIDTFRCINI